MERSPEEGERPARVDHERGVPSFTPVVVSDVQSDPMQHASNHDTSPNSRKQKPAATSMPSRVKNYVSIVYIAFAVGWRNAILCLRYALGDEDTDVTQLPERAQRLVLWYRRGPGKALVWKAVMFAVVATSVVLLYFVLMGAYGVAQTLLSDEAVVFKNNVHQFNPHHIRVKRFLSPRHIDHVFECECTPVKIGKYVPTERIPVYEKRSVAADETQALDTAIDGDAPLPDMFVYYDNVFWVNSQLMDYDRAGDGIQSMFMSPKMWNVSASEQDRAFVERMQEFNPCVLSVRQNVSLVHMVNPRIMNPVQELTSEEFITIGYTPEVFEPFMGESDDSLVFKLYNSFVIRFYLYPHMEKRVQELTPDNTSIEFRIWLQLALIALHNGFQDELNAHGPFHVPDPAHSGAVDGMPDENAVDMANESAVFAGKLRVNNERVIVDTDDDGFIETHVELNGETGAFVRRVVNGKTQYVSQKRADQLDAEARDEL